MRIRSGYLNFISPFKEVRTISKELIEELKRMEIQLHELRKENADLRNENYLLQQDKTYLQKRLKKVVLERR